MDDMGTYLERDPEDYEHALRREFDQTIGNSFVVVEISHPALKDKVRGFIPLPKQWTKDDLKTQIPGLISYGLNDIL